MISVSHNGFPAASPKVDQIWIDLVCTSLITLTFTAKRTCEKGVHKTRFSHSDLSPEKKVRALSQWNGRSDAIPGRRRAQAQGSSAGGRLVRRGNGAGCADRLLGVLGATVGRRFTVRRGRSSHDVAVNLIWVIVLAGGVPMALCRLKHRSVTVLA